MPLFNNVLLVDDDPMFNYLNESFIDAVGLSQTIISYSESDKALGFLRKITRTDKTKFPEIIFLDINMPVLDGWEFLNEIGKLPWSILNKCDVFMLSSSIDQNDIIKSKTFRMVKGFISKPLTTEVLESLFPTLKSVA